jgi:hypothetical protein
MNPETHSNSSETPRVLAFVCDADARIESVATMLDITPQLSAGRCILDALSPAGADDLRSAWHEMVATDGAMQSEVTLELFKGGETIRMLFHAMPLHKGDDEGRFLINLCSGFRAIAAGPDEIARCRAVLDTAVDAIVTINRSDV